MLMCPAKLFSSDVSNRMTKCMWEISSLNPIRNWYFASKSKFFQDELYDGKCGCGDIKCVNKTKSGFNVQSEKLEMIEFPHFRA